MSRRAAPLDFTPGDFPSHSRQLGPNGSFGARAELQPEDLKIQSSVPVLRDDMGLKVKRIGFDPLRRETVFELWASLEPQYLPFEVTTRRDPQISGLTTGMGLGKGVGDTRTESPTTGQGADRISSKPPVLAKPGTPATLVMLGQNVRITTTVVPLQPGGKGPAHSCPRYHHRARDECGSGGRRAVADQFLSGDGDEIEPA